nr:glycosyltransferase family 4 protein [Mucilaginibacter sp. Bleaf8]
MIVLHSINKSLGLEWLTDGLLKQGQSLSFVLLNGGESEMEAFLLSKRIPVVRLSYNSKIQAPLLLLKLCGVIKRFKPDVVHTHLRNADIYGQLAAYLCRVKSRISTRHYSTLNHLYYSKAVVVDKLINSLATDIVAISEVTKKVLIDMEQVDIRKVCLIHHGFDLESFRRVDSERIDRLNKKYDFPANSVKVGVFARYIHLKGYQYIIPALGELKRKYPELHFIFANAVGDYTKEIKTLIAEHLPPGSCTEIAFENDIQAFYKVLDIYIHAPIDKTVEAFGQTYVEALASGVPSVFTLSGVANEFIVHERNALVVPYQDSKAIADAVDRLLKDDALRAHLSANGAEDVKRFSLNKFIEQHLRLYQTSLQK